MLSAAASKRHAERNERPQAHREDVFVVAEGRSARAQRSPDRRPTCAGPLDGGARGPMVPRRTHLDAPASRYEGPRLREARLVIARVVRCALAERDELAFASRCRHVQRAVRSHRSVGVGPLRERPHHSDDAEERGHQQPKPGGAMQHRHQRRALRSRLQAPPAVQRPTTCGMAACGMAADLTLGAVARAPWWCPARRARGRAPRADARA